MIVDTALRDVAYQATKDLCGFHRDNCRQWRDWHYDPRHPREPGGGPLMDSRTSHDERARAWDRYNADQIELTASICRSGRSPQCGPCR